MKQIVVKILASLAGSVKKVSKGTRNMPDVCLVAFTGLHYISAQGASMCVTRTREVSHVEI